jgi:microcystin degradation protein MlrC
MEASVARAASLGNEAALHGPIVLADHGDNCGAGGITDVVAVLEEAMKQGLDDLVAGPYCDPSTVELATAAGVGAEITVSLGGKIDMPAIGLDARPLTITARVAAVSDGRYLVSGPMGTGTTANIGNTVLLEAGGVDILVSSLPLEPFDLGFYTHIGIDPTTRKYLLIKSRQHFRAVFEPIASEIIPVAGPGVCSEDYSIRTFDRIRRPMYPMDLNTPMTVIGN